MSELEEILKIIKFKTGHSLETIAEMDVPIERAQKLLGHRDKKSTEIYYHIKNKVLDAEMRKWDEL